MRVYLVQHGEAKDEKEDPQRRLTDKGSREVRKVADFLRALSLAVQAIWHSGKARAQQTAELLAEAIGAQGRIAGREGLGPKDPVVPTKEALDRTDDDVMIVGHLPFLGRLAGLLVTGSEENDVVGFQFGCVVCLERRPDRKWAVAWMITPALLT